MTFPYSEICLPPLAGTANSLSLVAERLKSTLGGSLSPYPFTFPPHPPKCGVHTTMPGNRSAKVVSWRLLSLPLVVLATSVVMSSAAFCLNVLALDNSWMALSSFYLTSLHFSCPPTLMSFCTYVPMPCPIPHHTHTLSTMIPTSVDLALPSNSRSNAPVSSWDPVLPCTPPLTASSISRQLLSAS